MSAALRTLTVMVTKISPKTRWVFVEIARDDGAIGLGEATLNGSEIALLAAAAEYAPLLWSQNADAPAGFAAPAAPSDLARAAMVSAIDLALWDLHAQDAGNRLVDALHGARRETITVYANINRRTEVRTPAGFAQSARDALAAGFRALKIAPFDEVSVALCARGDGIAAMQAGLARLAAVRAVAGPACRLMVDCHWRFDEVTAARMIDAAAEQHVHWIECPLPEIHGNLAALVSLRSRANGRGALLAGMENGIGSDSFAPYCAAGAYDVMMPDVKYVGGLAEMLRCSELFARHGVAMSPHNPSGPVAHAASLHVSAAMEHFDMLELQFDESPLFDLLVTGLPPREHGHSRLPAGAGLGVRLDTRLMAAHLDAAPHVWGAP
jgi:galactonate dehydratase